MTGSKVRRKKIVIFLKKNNFKILMPVKIF